MRKELFPILFCLLLLVPLSPLSAAEDIPPLPFSHSEWTQFLKRFVNEKGEVNYQAARQEPALLHSYLERIKSIPAGEFKNWSREERIAVFINAYNSGVVKMILDHYPVKSVMEIPGVWEEPALSIGTFSKEEGSLPYSLNQIQRSALRQKFRDEKILLALCSGAVSSPPLQREAYEGPRLEGQLYFVTQKFVNDESRNQIEPAEKRVVLSRLFKWYGGDFLFNWGDFQEEKKWNPQQMAVLSFFAHYLKDPKKVEFLKEGKYKVKYSDFDWSLNEWKSAAAAKGQKEQKS